MTQSQRDPLLRIAMAFVLFMMALAIVAVCAGVVASIIISTGWGNSSVYLTVADKGFRVTEVWNALGLIAAGIATCLVLLRFLFELRGIIASVGTGDPFIPENASRLQRMAWLALAIQAIGAILASVAWFMGDKIHAMEIKISSSGNGFIMALVLFVLARVFREGTRMREELEGTI